MGLRDIVFGVDADFSGLTSKAGILGETIQTLAGLALQAQRDFSSLEQQASRLGQSLEEFSGISTETADVYRDLRSVTERLEVSYKSLLVNVMKPVNKEFEEQTRNILNLTNAIKAGDLQNAFRQARASPLFNPFSFLTPAKEVIRVTDEEAFAREDRRQGADKRLAGSISEQFQGGLQKERDRQARRAQDLQERETRRLQFREIDLGLSQQFKAIDRETFVRNQAIALQDTSGLIPTSVRRAQQAIQLKQFDVSQAASGQKDQLRDAAQAARAQITNEGNTKRANELHERQIRILEEIRDKRIEAAPAGSEVGELVEDILG